MNKLKIDDLYSLFRPKKLKNIFGRNNVIHFLEKTIQTNIIPNFIFFYGSYGSGKTSVARIYAKIVNCLSKENIKNKPCNECLNCINYANYTYEFNSSNYTQIDNMRDLIEDSKFMPFFGKYKFYILDELHMLSVKSFNILLKEVEEPNQHVKYIGITTNISSIPEILLSRSICINFENLNNDDFELIKNNLIEVANENNINFDTNKFKNCNIFNLKNKINSARDLVNFFIKFIIDDDINQILNNDQENFEKYVSELFMLNKLSLSQKINIVKNLELKKISIENLLNYVLKENIFYLNKINLSDDKFKTIIKISDMIIESFDYSIKNINSFYILIIKIHSLWLEDKN